MIFIFLQTLSNSDDAVRAQRFESLKFLLSKSKVYTKYLSERIDRRKKEKHNKETRKIATAKRKVGATLDPDVTLLNKIRCS